ncbi:MAG: hypothetical protein R3B72_36105 [Polyangiaceae bacterium]
MNGKHTKVRLSDDDLVRLAAVVEATEGATLSGVLRAAMRIGLDRIERKPSILDAHELDTRGGAREGAGRKPSKAKGAKR